MKNTLEEAAEIPSQLRTGKAIVLLSSQILEFSKGW